MANRELARELGVTESAVKTHLSRILGTLDVSDRTNAVNRAIELGLNKTGAALSETRWTTVLPARQGMPGTWRSRVGMHFSRVTPGDGIVRVG